MKTSMTNPLTLTQIQDLARQGGWLKGRFEVTCLGLVMGRYATLDLAIRMARKLERQTDAPVLVK